MYLEAFGLNGCDWNLYGVWHRSTNGMSTDEHSERLREFGAEGHKDDRSSGLRKERQTHWWVNERAEKGVRDAECVSGGGGGGRCFPRPLCVTSVWPCFMAILLPLHTVAVQILFSRAPLPSSTPAPKPQAGSAGIWRCCPPPPPDYPLIHTRSNMSYPHFSLHCFKHAWHTLSHTHLSRLRPVNVMWDVSRCYPYFIHLYKLIIQLRLW